jgi:hypothetical protein
MEHYHLKEAEWQYIYSYLQEITRIRKENEKVLRNFIEGIFLF